MNAHKIIWQIIDDVAAKRGTSVSRLAVDCGLDSTTFNKSRRETPTGLHFPSLPSIMAVMALGGMNWHDFAKQWEKIGAKNGK